MAHKGSKSKIGAATPQGAKKNAVPDPDAIAKRIASELGTVLRIDPADLIETRYCACRYCWGAGHQYQWRSSTEYFNAYEEALCAGQPLPRGDGGVGYSETHAANPDCPECDGAGLFRMAISNVSAWPRDAMRLVRRIRPGATGPEIELANFPALVAAFDRLRAGTNEDERAESATVRVVRVPEKAPPRVREEPLPKEEQDDDE